MNNNSDLSISEPNCLGLVIVLESNLDNIEVGFILTASTVKDLVKLGCNITNF